MNGGGKLRPDPGGRNDFVARVGEVVMLTVSSDEGRVAFTLARYNGQQLDVNAPILRFQIISGPAILSLMLEGPMDTRTIRLEEIDLAGQRHELVNIRDWAGQVLNFRILGVD